MPTRCDVAQGWRRQIKREIYSVEMKIRIAEN